MTILLYFTGLASILIASESYGYDIKSILLSSLGIILGVMGANATTAYIDRKMDSTMERTRNRPVPTGKIGNPINALFFGLSLVVAGTILVGLLNYLSAIFLLLGFLDSAVIYNALSKKKSPLNIVFGAPAGGMPVFVGWAAIAKGLDLIPVTMFLLILVWTPIHIWSLAYFYKEDYKKACVPMLPVLVSKKKIFITLSILNIALVVFSIMTGLLLGLSIYFIVLSALAGIPLIVFAALLFAREKERFAWQLFKYSSPYLTFIFLLLILEYTVIGPFLL